MMVGIVTGAAVWVLGIAIALDERRIVGLALEALRASSELGHISFTHHLVWKNNVLYHGEEATYALSAARANIVRQADPVVGITHEDGHLDRGERAARQSNSGAAAQRVVDDLAALRVSDQHNLGVRAPLVQAFDGIDHGNRALARRLFVLNTAAAALTTTGWVGDG